jgi:polyhydroxyalkanoate synthesis regulator phasin
MKKNNQIVWLGLLALGMASVGQAVWADEAAVPAAKPEAQSRIEKRMANQEKRIEAGVKSGKLSTDEAKKLEEGQAKIKSAETQALSDGKLDQKEARKLRRMERRASREIRSKAHN